MKPKEMPNLHLFFSHALTSEQVKDAQEKLGCKDIISLPYDLQQKWQQIPPEGELNNSIIKPFIYYLSHETEVGDYVLVQGEFGVSFMIVNWCLKNNRIPIYATTKRVVKEEKKPDGSVEKVTLFKHVQFRRYNEKNY